MLVCACDGFEHAICSSVCCFLSIYNSCSCEVLIKRVIFTRRQTVTSGGRRSDSQTSPVRLLGALAALSIEQEAQSVCFHWTWRQSGSQQENSSHMITSQHKHTHKHTERNGSHASHRSIFNLNSHFGWFLLSAAGAESWRQIHNKEKWREWLTGKGRRT